MERRLGQEQLRDTVGLRRGEVHGDHTAAAPAHHGRGRGIEGFEQRRSVLAVLREPRPDLWTESARNHAGRRQSRGRRVRARRAPG